MAKKSTKEESHDEVPRPSQARQYLEALLIAALFLSFSNTFVVKTFYIPSSSMETTLLVGDHLFVNRFIYGPADSRLEDNLLPSREVRRGDIVIFRAPEDPKTDLVKRCVGLPGDEIRIVDKELLVNGQPFDDDAFTRHVDQATFSNSPRMPSQHRNRDNFGPVVVPEGHFFFLGDNRDKSYDSRFWGPVPAHYLKGRASVIYWSYGGQVDAEWRGWREKLGKLFRTFAGFFTETRWERTFHLVR